MDLTGKLLIAMPGMQDPRFEHAVVLICAHGDDGAMGLILNKPLPKPGLNDLFEQLDIPVKGADEGDGGAAAEGSAPAAQRKSLATDIGTVLADGAKAAAAAQASGTRSQPILFGGPVETGRGFVLHSTEWRGVGEAMEVAPDLAMTGTRDILEDIAAGVGPRRSVLALGYAGWAPGQLEQEILDNGWLTCDGNTELALSDDHANKWASALGLMGIEPRMLSAAAGHA